MSILRNRLRLVLEEAFELIEAALGGEGAIEEIDEMVQWNRLQSAKAAVMQVASSVALRPDFPEMIDALAERRKTPAPPQEASVPVSVLCDAVQVLERYGLLHELPRHVLASYEAHRSKEKL